MGAGFKWNIFDWNKNSNERKSLSIQQQLIDIRQQCSRRVSAAAAHRQDGGDSRPA
ncbi:MAG: hypothetical protein MZV63_25140 [Marinilabiliales bacterium]|nr:hypothetical protein [Marinilabiliales bacterium]